MTEQTPADLQPVPHPIAPAAKPTEEQKLIAEARTWGRVEADGTVFVREATGERKVGQFPQATPDEALAYYVRKYTDLLAQVTLFETRLNNADPSLKDVEQTLARLTEQVASPDVVGNLDSLRAKVEAIRPIVAEKREQIEAERKKAKEEALKHRTDLVERAEKIAGRDPGKIQWRQSGDELRKLLDDWKLSQNSGPRIDRTVEESLWKRFSQARTSFDKARRHFFSELEEKNASAKVEKEKIIAEAEKLATSKDWGPVTSAFKDLMTRWKKAGHAGRKDDDALWTRFRAAQDQFFDARSQANAVIDEEYGQNLTKKLAVLEEVEKILPITDLNAAKKTLRRCQDEWDSIGKVPRNDVQKVEARMRVVEQAVREAEDKAWKKSNPETKARAEGLAAQLEAAIASLESDLVEAQASGDAKRIADAQAALDARREWLAQAKAASEEFSG